MYQISRFVDQSVALDRSIRYKWDEWGSRFGPIRSDEKIGQRLSHLTHRAVGAFAVSAAEWVVSRYESMIETTVPRLCLEAASAQLVDFRYSSYWDLEGDWSGPIKGPIRVAFDFLSLTLESISRAADPAADATVVSALAYYVINSSDSYKRWELSSLDRLKTLYPFDSQDTLGGVVPREALDTGRPFLVDETETLINRFLASVDHLNNPFLNPPQEMLKRGFSTTPYVFNNQEDMRVRREQ